MLFFNHLKAGCRRFGTWLVLLLGLAFSALYAATLTLTLDQNNLLYLGYQFAVAGEWIHHGNPTSGVFGNVPGSLTALLMGLPLLVYNSYYSIALFVVFLHLLAWWLIDQTLKRHVSPDFRFAFLVLFWLNPWRLSEAVIWNPAYLFLFSAIHIWSADKLRQRPRFMYTVIHVLSIGLAAQLHLSAVLLMLASLLMMAKKWLRLSLPGIVVGCLLFLLSLAPYLIEFDPAATGGGMDAENGSFLGRGLAYVYPLLKGVSYWFRFGSAYFGSYIQKMVGFDWTLWPQLAKGAWSILTITVSLLTLAVSVVFNWKFFRYRGVALFRRDSASELNWLEQYVVACFFSLLITCAIAPITLLHWHILLFFVPALWVVVHGLEYRTVAPLSLPVAVRSAAVYFVVINMLAPMQSYRHALDASPGATYLNNVAAGMYERRE